MKLLIIGSDEIYAIENFYFRHLRDAGISVQLYPAQKFFYRYYQKSFFNKIFFKLRLSTILHSINKKIKEIVINYKPDVIWVFKGMEVFPSTLIWCKERGIKLVNYNPDNPFIFSGAGSGNKNVTDSLKLFDLHFTYNTQIQKEMENRSINAKYLPFGFEDSKDVHEVFENKSEILKLCFIGNPDTERVDFIKQIADKGVEIDLYGNNWDKYVNNGNLKTNNAIYGRELLNKLKEYRLQLNLMRIHNLDSHNMRTFEVPGVGGIMVAPLTSEHKTFFENGGEAFFFKDVDHAVKIINDVLNLSEKEANIIRTAARKRSLNSGYSYKERAFFVTNEIKKLLYPGS